MDALLIDQTSEQFLGQWKRLVSTTNWEKGAIIHHWREALRATDAPPSEYSDDAWSRRVGNVTPQHVGRLRRAYERFGNVRDGYQGLYWSHFQAALDWDDAELWLEGAVQNGWSIADMRQQRWQALGGQDEPDTLGVPGDEPWDDDAVADDASGEILTGTLGVVQAPERTEAEPDEDDAYDHSQFDASDTADDNQAGEPIEAAAPLAGLPSLPPDVSDAFESYKLCILRHRLAGWHEISCRDLVTSLDCLKQLALAPAEV